MVINSIKIKNFRCYYGESSISFNSNGKITLIYGDSGYGKSSLLQFFRWMFYSDPDFGKNDDKPLFNIAAYNECGFGDCIEVSGQIDFEHQGCLYRLSKKQFWSFAIRMENSTLETYDFSLVVDRRDGKGYVSFGGDVANQVNTILPKGLSKYFLLDGERARDIVLDSIELKKAIYSLFGLDAYEEAIRHIGYKNSSGTVLGQYQALMTSNMTQTGSTRSPAEIQEIIHDLNDIIENLTEQNEELTTKIQQKNARRDEILKTLGAVATKGAIQELIKTNEAAIKAQRAQIVEFQRKIGTLFYKNYPYLFLASLARSSSVVLRNKNAEVASNYRNVFENLKKDLLKEIITKNICVCGRVLDDESKERINAIIDIMPPDSYTYRFGQFVASAKRFIRDAQMQVMTYEHYRNQIASCEAEITRLENINQEKLDELRRLDDARDLVEELEAIRLEIAQLESERAGITKELAQKQQLYDGANRQLGTAMKNATVSSQYTDMIHFFEEILRALKEERDSREVQVRDTINLCVREIFKKLTTQVELDADKIQFINNDFSLRTTYLTGGQLSVDVYSYVIGIVKALQECNMANNENPIIIDAPFAFTGNEQSEHLFRTLPSVSRQTILLTLDLNKIRNLLNETDLYDFYVIRNDTQDKAVLERGDIHDIEF